jgi:hypothetical protein
VSQLAKAIGVSSATLLEVIRESGEYVRGPSSTIPIPVVRTAAEKVRARFPEAVGATAARGVETSQEPSMSFWQEAELIAGKRKPRRTPSSDRERRTRKVRVADLPPMVRQLLRRGTDTVGRPWMSTSPSS